MEDQLAHLRLMLGKLARGEEPYSGGLFDAEHLEIDQNDAQVLSGALDELEVRRARVTTGGPPAAFTQPPEEIVVPVPVSDEEAARLLSERADAAEAQFRAVDYVEKPPDR